MAEIEERRKAKNRAELLPIFENVYEEVLVTRPDITPDVSSPDETSDLVTESSCCHKHGFENSRTPSNKSTQNDIRASSVLNTEKVTGANSRV